MSAKWSFWEKELLNEEIDFLIIGAGIVGVTSAIFIKQENPSAKVIVLERNYPGLGASTKNAGFACYGSPTELLDDIEKNGEHHCSQLMRLRRQGFTILKSLVTDEQMDYHQKGSHELFENDDALLDKVLDRFEYLNQLASDAMGEKEVFKKVKNNQFGLLSAQAIYAPLEGQLNPALMMEALRKKATALGVMIQFGRNIVEVNGPMVKTEDGHWINAKRTVVCTNGFARLLLEIENLQTVRNQVLISEPFEHGLFGTYHMNEGYIYFREYKGRILIGGARDIDRNVETTQEFGENKMILNYLKNFVSNKLNLKEVSFTQHWSGILGVGPEKMPLIKQISPNLYVAVRMGGMGVAIGSAVGRKVSQLFT